jgi:hypothetical protein
MEDVDLVRFRKEWHCGSRNRYAKKGMRECLGTWYMAGIVN